MMRRCWDNAHDVSDEDDEDVSAGRLCRRRYCSATPNTSLKSPSVKLAYRSGSDPTMARKSMMCTAMLALVMICDSLARMLGRKRFTESGSSKAESDSACRHALIVDGWPLNPAMRTSTRTCCRAGSKHRR